MSSLTKQKKWIFALLCLGNVTISFNTGAVAASIPVISASFGLSDFEVSRIVAYYMLPYGLGALAYAYLTRVFFYRHVFIGAYFLYAGMSLLSALSQNLNVLLIAQIGAGIAAASSTPLSLMIFGDLYRKQIRGRLVGAYFGASFFAALCGMMFMGVAPWRWLFFVPTVLASLTVLLFIFSKVDLLNRRHNEAIEFLKVFSHRQTRNIFAFIFVISFLYHAVHKWYGVFLHQQYGMDVKAVSFSLTFAAGCGLLGQQIGGYFTDKYGRLFSARLGAIILSFGVMSLGLLFPKLFVPLVLGAISIGWTINHNSISTVLTDFPDKERPMVSSLNSSVRFISGALGFSISGFFVEKSFSTTFLTIGFIFLLLSFLIVKVVRPTSVEVNI